MLDNGEQYTAQMFAVIQYEHVFDRIHACEKDVEYIGRMKNCSILLPDPIVSRNHAAILKRDRHFVIRDLGSRNGTFVDARKLLAEEVILAGIPIDIGPYRLILFDALEKAIDFSGVSEITTQNGSPPSEHGSSVQALLTATQLRVYELLFEGLAEKEVASKLQVSVHTIHDHVKAIYRKLHVTTRGELLTRTKSAQRHLSSQNRPR